MKVRSTEPLREISLRKCMQRAKELLAAEDEEEEDSGDAGVRDGDHNVPPIPNGRPS